MPIPITDESVIVNTDSMGTCKPLVFDSLGRQPASLGETCGGYANIRCAVELKCQLKTPKGDRGNVADVAGVCISIKNTPVPFEVEEQPEADSDIRASGTARIGESCGG
jgi:hypothetical protein